MAYGYSSLSRAQLSLDYLHTNSTSHEFLFGALAEIVDNSRDAAAENLEVYTVSDKTLRGGTMLLFLDDGEGMDPTETANVITFGLSQKKAMDSTQIGQYGNGLKSASMRIANDLIVFTKKENYMTCLMISRTFLEEENISEVIVPLPSFDIKTLAPNYAGSGKGKNKEKDKHDLEMDLILKYSPFHTKKELFDQFNRIQETGTLVILYNLKLLDNGLTELDFKTDSEDILIEGTDLLTEKNLVPERYSFRAYVALLYSEPRMKIYIQKKKVRPVRFVYKLYKPCFYKYTSARFKARSKEEALKAELDYKAVKQKLIEADGRAREFQKSLAQTNMSKTDRTKLRNLQTVADDLRADARKKEIISERKQRSLREPKTLSFIFGIHLENRKCDGIFIYNCNRLIKMYERVGPQFDGGLKCRGVVGIINVPYLVLEPTLTKQDFTDAKEYRHLLKVLGEHMEHYWHEIGLGRSGVYDFWENYGYQSDNWQEMPSMDIQYLGRRARETKICLQCDECLNWRVLPYSSTDVGKVFSDNWICSMNTDSMRNKCSSAEEKPHLPELKFHKIEKSREDREAEMLEQFKRTEEKRNKQNQRVVVTSSKDANAIMAEVAKRRVDWARPLESVSNSSEADARELEDPEISEISVDLPQSKDERETPASMRKRINQDQTSMDSNNDEDVVYEYKRYPQPPRKKSRSTWEENTDYSNTDDWFPELSDDESVETPTKIEVGSRVEINVRNKWYIGSALRKTGSDLLIRLDKLPFAKYEKRISPKSENIRLAVGLQNTKTTSKTSDREEQICSNLRSMILFTMPPTWPMEGDDVQCLTSDQLASFQMDDFLRQYEDGIRKLQTHLQKQAMEQALSRVKDGSAVKNRMVEMSKKLKTTEAENNELQSTLGKLKEEISEWKQKCNYMEMELQQKELQLQNQVQVDNTNNRERALEQKIIQLNNTILELQNALEISRINSMANSLKKEKNDKEGEIEFLNSIITELQKENGQLRMQ